MPVTEPKPDAAPRALTIEVAAAAFGKPVSHIGAVARGRKLKGKEPLPIPTSFTVERHQFVRAHGAQFLAVTRRERWGDGRLVWATGYSPGLFKSQAEPQAALSTT